MILSLKKQALARQGYVIIETTPQGAEIFIDGAAIAYKQESPAKIPLVPGRHRVELRYAGFEVAHVVVLVEQDKTVRTHQTLKPLNATTRSRWVPWTLGSVGAATLMTGLAFHWSAAQTADEISRVDRDAYDRDVDAIRFSEGMAWTGYAVGAALITTALILSGNKPSSRNTSASARPQHPLVGWSF